MAATQKISVAMGQDELRLARTAAEEEGLSLSAYVTRAVRERLEERQRLEAAREFLATFAPDELPTPEEERQLLELWMRPRNAQSRTRRRPPATKRRRAR
jgi:hypothetical protein